jgi:hypothetical protein
MEAQPLRTHPFAQAPLPVFEDDFAWVYEDPDLAPFRGSVNKRRPETPLTSFV